MLAVELQLVSRSDLNSDDKYYVEPYKVYMSLIWLNGTLGTGAGDVAGGADFAPTESALAWLSDIEKDLDAAKARVQDARRQGSRRIQQKHERQDPGDRRRPYGRSCHESNGLLKMRRR